jgi:serine/threonine-protein kinase
MRNLFQKCIKFIRDKWRSKWVNRTFIIVLALILLFFFWDSFLMPLVTRHGKETQVPGIVGLTSEEAESLLKEYELGLRVVSEEHNSKRPAEVILSQNPEAGSMIKKGRNIRVSVSKGGKLVEVPNLRGVSLRQAEIHLSEVGLKIGNISLTYDDSFPEDVVVSAIPSFGTSIRKGTSVNLTVNKFTPEEAVIVPQFVGKNLEQAQNLAEEAGLEIGIIRYKVDKSLLPQTVVGQTPKAGAEVNRGSMVELVISITE